MVTLHSQTSKKLNTGDEEKENETRRIKNKKKITENKTKTISSQR